MKIREERRGSKAVTEGTSAPCRKRVKFSGKRTLFRRTLDAVKRGQGHGALIRRAYFYVEEGRMGLYITNNPLVRDHAECHSAGNTVYIEPCVEEGYMDVLVRVRDYIHKGHTLLTHPLSGSVKPGETPYKTVIISESAAVLDADSLRIIEESIITARKFPMKIMFSEKVLEDFRLIDFGLIFGK